MNISFYQLFYIDFLTDNLRFFIASQIWLAMKKLQIISEGISIVNKWVNKFCPSWARVQHSSIITILHCSVAVALLSRCIIGQNSYKTDNRAIWQQGHWRWWDCFVYEFLQIHSTCFIFHCGEKRKETRRWVTFFLPCNERDHSQIVADHMRWWRILICQLLQWQFAN